MAAKALVRISQRIDRMIAPMRGDRAHDERTSIGLNTESGEPTGEWIDLPCDRQPCVDSGYRFCLSTMPLDSSVSGCRLRIFLRDRRGRIEIGVVDLEEGATEFVVNLGDLRVRPGYLPWEVVELEGVWTGRLDETFLAQLAKTTAKGEVIDGGLRGGAGTGPVAGGGGGGGRTTGTRDSTSHTRDRNVCDNRSVDSSPHRNNREDKR